MEISAGNIAKHELIGLKARVISSKNRSDVGIEGKIIDETKNMINISGKKVLKKNVGIEVTIKDKKITIDGEKLLKNPVDRTKLR